MQSPEKRSHVRRLSSSSSSLSRRETTGRASHAARGKKERETKRKGEIGETRIERAALEEEKEDKAKEGEEEEEEQRM